MRIQWDLTWSYLEVPNFLHSQKTNGGFSRFRKGRAFSWASCSRSSNAKHTAKFVLIGEENANQQIYIYILLDGNHFLLTSKIKDNQGFQSKWKLGNLVLRFYLGIFRSFPSKRGLLDRRSSLKVEIPFSWLNVLHPSNAYVPT